MQQGGSEATRQGHPDPETAAFKGSARLAAARLDAIAEFSRSTNRREYMALPPTPVNTSQPQSSKPFTSDMKKIGSFHLLFLSCRTANFLMQQVACGISFSDTRVDHARSCATPARAISSGLGNVSNEEVRGLAVAAAEDLEGQGAEECEEDEGEKDGNAMGEEGADHHDRCPHPAGVDGIACSLAVS